MTKKIAKFRITDKGRELTNVVKEHGKAIAPLRGRPRWSLYLSRGLIGLEEHGMSRRTAYNILPTLIGAKVMRIKRHQRLGRWRPITLEVTG